MLSYLYRMLDWCRWMFGVVPRSAVGSPRLFLTMHYSFMALIAILLSVFSPPIRNWLPWLPETTDHVWPWVDRIWCGVLFVLTYGIIRIVLHLMQILGLEDDSEFPDIEADWNDIITALERERLYIDDMPLFLVNGLTPQQEQSAFEAASGVEWRVVAPPLTQTSAVVRVFARDDAVFLCCSGVGATNCQQGKVAYDQEPESGAGVPRQARSNITGTLKAGDMSNVAPPPRSITGTLPAGGAAAAASPAPTPAAPGISRPANSPTGTMPRVNTAAFGTMLPGGLKKAMQSFAAINQSNVKGFGKKRVIPISEMESLIGIRRMRFLCHLIQNARKPFCGINGMLQAIPLSWASDIDYSRKLAPAVRDDIVAVHSSFQLQFPVVAVVTELDDVGGIKEFLLRSERLQPGLRLSRAGASFAAGADVSEANAEWVIDRGLQWFRGWAYTAFSHDIENRDNSRVFQMVCDVGQRRDALVLLLRDAFYRVLRPNMRLQGVYFCATGRTAIEQGFVRGVLDKLSESQNDVAWTPQLIKTQQRSKLFAIGLFVGFAAMVAGTIFMLIEISKKI